MNRLKLALLLGATLLAQPALSKGPDDFARQWPVLGTCSTAAPEKNLPTLDCEGAFALELDESVYRQVVTDDLGDLAAFNGKGEPMAFGPMPAAYAAPPSRWETRAWFALPRIDRQAASDLHLHVTRGNDGTLALDASLSHGAARVLSDVLVDVRAEKRAVEGIELELLPDAADFSVEVAIDASDDLQHWEPVVPSAVFAHLRQSGQSLVRRQVRFAPRQARYLRLHVLGDGNGVPLAALQLLLQPPAGAFPPPPRSRLAATLVRREGRAFVYALPARVPADQVNVRLAGDNAIAEFSVSARNPGEKYWQYLGQMTAFRLRGAGIALDNEAMDIAPNRMREWRIESSVDLANAPELEMAYRPERWLLLTHGPAPYAVAAGSRVARRDAFPLDALVAQVRSRYGKAWEPSPAVLGNMQTAGGEAALSAYDPDRRRTWLLWGVLVLGAGLIIAMVLRLLKSPPPE